MAARAEGVSYDRLHHFIAAGIWDAAPLEQALVAQADRLVIGTDAILAVDDTALPKKGERSVGVAPQYAITLGKNANCQALVSLTLARGEVPVAVASGCSCPRFGQAIPTGWHEPASPRICVACAPRQRSPCARSTGCAPRVHASALCWPMPATGVPPRSGRR
ncbi:transposase [Methylorubrum extorquens]|uniref:transposase n=1 Tax=Methylorubrum extorquens TaxID=408 RepID=UPI003CC75E55